MEEAVADLERALGASSSGDALGRLTSILRAGTLKPWLAGKQRARSATSFTSRSESVYRAVAALVGVLLQEGSRYTDVLMSLLAQIPTGRMSCAVSSANPRVARELCRVCPLHSLDCPDVFYDDSITLQAYVRRQNIDCARATTAATTDLDLALALLKARRATPASSLLRSVLLAAVSTNENTRTTARKAAKEFVGEDFHDSNDVDATMLRRLENMMCVDEESTEACVRLLAACVPYGTHATTTLRLLCDAENKNSADWMRAVAAALYKGAVIDVEIAETLEAAVMGAEAVSVHSINVACAALSPVRLGRCERLWRDAVDDRSNSVSLRRHAANALSKLTLSQETLAVLREVCEDPETPVKLVDACVATISHATMS